MVDCSQASQADGPGHLGLVFCPDVGSVSLEPKGLDTLGSFPVSPGRSRSVLEARGLLCMLCGWPGVSAGPTGGAESDFSPHPGSFRDSDQFDVGG